MVVREIIIMKLIGMAMTIVEIKTVGGQTYQGYIRMYIWDRVWIIFVNETILSIVVFS